MRMNSCKVVGQLKTTWEELVNIVAGQGCLGFLFDSCVQGDTLSLCDYVFLCGVGERRCVLGCC